MTWYSWAAVSALAVSTLISILAIGRPRPVMTPQLAVLTTIVNGLFIWAIFALASH